VTTAFGQVFAGVAVEDFDRAIDWYELLFGGPPDVVVREGEESMWQVADRAWIYVVADAGRAGNALLTLLVDDLDARIASIASRGIKGSAEDSEPGLYRKVSFEDPDGNTITIGQSLKPAVSER